MNQQCVRTGDLIDERAARTAALFVTAGLVLFWWTGSPIIPLFLVIDFTLRAFRQARYSPVAALSRTALRLARIAPLRVDAGPKLFAARLGLGFSVLLTTFALSGSSVGARVVTVLFAAPAAAEAFAGYCVGCRIYMLLQQARQIRNRRTA